MAPVQFLQLDPTVQSWLLAVPYLLVALGFFLMIWAAGGYFYALLCGRGASLADPWYTHAPGAGIFLFAVRVAAGLCLISWVSALFGVAGLFRSVLVLPVLVVLIIGGKLVGSRYGYPQAPLLRRDRLDMGHDWITSPRPERWLCAGIILTTCALAVNALIGALVPDMNQDPMWYHLSVPQQWVFAQRFEVYPNVMPSAYPLAVEALYATIFLIETDPVLCSLLNVLCGLMLFVAMAGAAAAAFASSRAGAHRGWGVCAVVGVWVPMISVYGMLAPIQPKNDIITMFLAFTGVMTIWLPLLAARQVPHLRWWAVGGLILGTACSAKPTVLGVSFLAMLFAIPLSVTYGRRAGNGYFRQTIIGVVAAVAYMLLAMAPWIFRGLTAHGLPFYPLGRSLVPVAPEFQPLVNTFDSLHGIAGPRFTDWLVYASLLPGRLAFAGANGEKGIFLFIMVCLVGVVATRGRWRWFSLMLSANLLVFVGMKGSAEVFRFLAPAYVIATPLVAWLVGNYAGQMQRRQRLLVGALLWLSIVASVGWHQVRVASFKTMRWKFRPVLSQEDIAAYASHAEKGWLYLDYPAIRSRIEPDERVLLIGTPYPFYLHRNVLWNDEGIGKGGLADRWKAMSPSQAEEFFDSQNIDAVLVKSSPDPAGESNRNSGTSENLDAEGILQPVKLPDSHEENGWRLYRVNRR